MAITLSCDTRQTLSIDDYVEHIRRLDLRDVDSLLASAPLLRALANDRGLVVRRLNEQVYDSFSNKSLMSAQTVFLAGGTDFYVRAAIWPSSSDVAGGLLYKDKFAYHIAHDHNFSFLTVNYLGPGYETELYEYDYGHVRGSVGETVDLRFLEKARFGHGSVMFYRANRDVHIQYPPEELTITLNLMISLPEVRARDQFYFDVKRNQILSYPPETESSKRVSLVKLAGLIGDVRTCALLEEVSLHHPCRRTRLSAYEALLSQQPDRTDELWERAARDRDAYVSTVAAGHLQRSSSRG